MALRILHLSDIHFGCENSAAVAAVADYVHRTRFDLLVVSGDVTQVGARPEFAAAAAWVEALPGPRIVAPGNHDTPWLGLIERVVSPFGRYQRALGPIEGARFDAPGLSVRTVNSARGWQVRLNWSKGHVSRRQSREAARALGAAPAQACRILVCHHPLLEAPGEPITSRVRGGHHAAAKLTSARVDLVLSGHLHTPFVQPLPCGDRQTFAVGAGTLSQRERGVGPSFNVIDIDGAAVNVTAMVHGAGGLAPLREWTVFLRPRGEA